MQDSITTLNNSLRQALAAINAQPVGIAFVNDENGKLCGVLTDGDVRRQLLDGGSLDDMLRDMPLGDYVYGKVGEDINELMAKTNRKIRVIPLVNDDGVVVDYFRYDHRVHIPVAMPDLGGNELRYVTDAVLSTWISSSGKYLTKFEEDFAEFCECKHGVAVSNGTVALHLALAALRIGPGDEVIVPDFTFAASVNAVLHAGATPVIVDVERESWCIDPDEVRKHISPRTKAIMPVHIYGQPANMDAIMALAEEHNLYVVEDAAEAHGARYRGKRVGSIGHIGCFSFFGNKVITTGEGGMCVTNSPELDDRMRVLRDHGMNKQKRYWHDEVGYNYRMTNLQAAIGCAQLERIESIIQQRRDIESAYQRALADTGLFEFQRGDLEHREKVVWLVSALVTGNNRADVIERLKNAGIDARPSFYSLSDMPVYKEYSRSAEVSRYISERGLSLPTHKDIDLNKIDAVAAALQHERTS